MIEERTWREDSEGNLARTWEQRLKPRVEPRSRRRRIFIPWAGTVVWIGAVWIGAVIASVLAIHVLTMSYQYDQMNQQYSALVRNNQSLAMSVASLTSVNALQQDAARLKVSMVVPEIQTMTPAHMATRSVKSPTIIEIMTSWIRNMSHSLAR